MHMNPLTLKGNVLTSHCSVLALHTPASLALFLFLKHTEPLPASWLCLLLFSRTEPQVSSSVCHWPFHPSSYSSTVISWQRLSLILPCKKPPPGFPLALCPVISLLYLIQHLCLFSVFACLLHPYHISSWGILGWWTARVLELDSFIKCQLCHSRNTWPWLNYLNTMPWIHDL